MKLYEDSRGPGTCRSCGGAIEWAELISGKRHPFNVPIVVLPALQVEVDGTRTIQTVDMNRTTSHFATCPDAKKWSRGKKR